MQNVKTHFEQVPLEKIRAIIEIHAEEMTEEFRVAEEDFSDVSLREITIGEEEREQPTSGREFKFPEWQIPLQELLLEFDREKAAQKTQAVESLVLERLQQLKQQADGHGEREAINDALHILRAIKRDKLGFPDWK